MAQAPTAKEFATEVFPAELAEIHRRRQALGIDAGLIAERVDRLEERLKTADIDAQKQMGIRYLMKGFRQPKHAPEKMEPQAHVKPTTEFGLVGLAISGG